MKRFLTVCAALLLTLTVLPAPAAAAEEDCLALAVATDGEDIVAAAPAVVYRNGGACEVVTDSSVHVSNAAGYLVLLGEEIVEMSYTEEHDGGLAVFRCEALSQPEVLDVAESVQLDEEMAYYFYCNGNGDDLTVLTGSARIVESNGGKSFSVTLPSGVEEDAVLYPAIAVNQAGELVVIDGTDGVWCKADINGSGSAPAPAPEDPAPAPDNSSTDPRGRDNPSSTPAPPEPTSSDSDLPIVWIVGIAVVLAVVVVLAVMQKRKKSGANTAPVQPVTPPPASPIPPAPVTPEPVELPPPPPPQPPKSVLYLCCEGGALDGRRYPIGTTTLFIGRDPSCNIVYPKETPGVSRRHCQIYWKNGVLNIMDLGSTSGTFIRGKGQITPNVPIAVNAGDTFYLGEKRNAFVIRLEG